MIKDRDGLVNCHPDSEPDPANWFRGRIRPYAVSLMLPDTGRAACCLAVGIDMVPGRCKGLVKPPVFWRPQEPGY